MNACPTMIVCAVRSVRRPRIGLSRCFSYPAAGVRSWPIVVSTDLAVRAALRPGQTAPVAGILLAADTACRGRLLDATCAVFGSRRDHASRPAGPFLRVTSAYQCALALGSHRWVLLAQLDLRRRATAGHCWRCDADCRGSAGVCVRCSSGPAPGKPRSWCSRVLLAKPVDARTRSPVRPVPDGVTFQVIGAR
jgi:hypothetical protein